MNPFYLKLGLLALICFVAVGVSAQTTDSTRTGKPEIDPSKPTNLYTQVNLNPEATLGDAQNLYGVRVNVQYAFNPNNLLLVEVPVLYNDRTTETGLSDVRVRYFTVVKRNLSKRFIALAPFLDVTLPTGNFENGLGTSAWSVAGGIVGGFVLSKKLSLFPGVSYIHLTEPQTDQLPEATKFASNGVGFQLNASYRFNTRTFLFINPFPSLIETNGVSRMIWAGEVNLNHFIVPNKWKLNAYWSPNFTAELTTLRLGLTVFL